MDNEQRSEMRTAWINERDNGPLVIMDNTSREFGFEAGWNARTAEVEALRQEVERLKRMVNSEWFAIDSAERDGKAVLLYPCGIFGAKSADIGYWDRDEESEGGQCWRSLDGSRIAPSPTVWQEIPEFYGHIKTEDNGGEY